MEKKVRILFVEDNQNAARAAKIMLELRGYAVDTAENVTKAREALHTNSYHILISDIALPDGSGTEIAHEANIPAIALSGYTTNDDRDSALQNGFSAFLAKPFQTDELIRTIQLLAG